MNYGLIISFFVFFAAWCEISPFYEAVKFKFRRFYEGFSGSIHIGFNFLIFAGEFPELDSWAWASPSISVPEPRYEFAPVVDGKEIIYEFIIQNKGDAPLIIERVKTD